MREPHVTMMRRIFCSDRRTIRCFEVINSLGAVLKILSSVNDVLQTARAPAYARILTRGRQVSHEMIYQRATKPDLFWSQAEAIWKVPRVM